MPCIDSIALEIKEKRKAEENTDCASIYFTHKAMSIVRSALFKKKKKNQDRKKDGEFPKIFIDVHLYLYFINYEISLLQIT